MTQTLKPGYRGITSELDGLKIKFVVIPQAMLLIITDTWCQGISWIGLHKPA